jgi:putative ABC transport system permease protein
MTGFFYRLLLRLFFPTRMRRELGDDMAQLFRDQFLEARRQGKSGLRVAVEAIGDAVVHGTTERLASARDGVRALIGSTGGWRSWMRAIHQDVTYAVRLLGRQPGVSLLAIVTLALGIRANTAIFSAVNAVLLRPLPYRDADRLVMVYEKRAAEGVLDNPVSPADFLDWSRMNGAFAPMAAFATATVDLTGTGEPVRLAAGTVSPQFFDVLGVQPMLGRTFRPEEAMTGQHHVAILANGLWRKRFDADPSVVGRRIMLDATAYEIVGVLPPTFEFPERTLELWMPLALEGSPRPPSRTIHYLSVFARMKHGMTLERARAEMDRVGSQLQQQYPDANRNHAPYVSPLSIELHAPVRESLLGLLAAVAFVLLIACVNVANLLLAKAASRRREMAVRAALGASRVRLAGQALTESVLLAVCGGGAGLLVAAWGIGLLRRLAPDGVPVLGADRVGLDLRVLAFTLALSIATGMLFGLLPAWQLASQDVNESLKDGGRSPGGVRRRLRLALVVSEIALASLLLVGAGLTLRSFQSLLRADPGFRQHGLMTAFISLPGGRYRDDARRVATYDEIERRLGALPGVTSIGGTSHLPLSGQDSRSGIVVEGRDPTPDTPTRAHPRAVTLGYFKTMGIPLLAGRSFSPADDSDAPFVVIVNQTMARRYWPGGSAVGKRVRLGGDSGQWREVIGVVRDVKHWGYDRPVNPEMYVPQRQMVWDGLTFVLATDGDPAGLTAAIREQLRTVDPDLPLSRVRTMADVAAQSIAARHAAMLLLGIFGGFALLLSSAGIYGVMSHLVALRSGEIGIRMTLGAQPAAVMRLVLREGLVQAIAGLAIGITGGVVLMRGFRAVLYQVGPADPLTLVGVAVILLGTTLMACALPARRAMRVDPVTALRN